MKNIEYCRRQIQLSMLRAQWWMASATSGHYKQRGLERATGNKNPDGTFEFRKCTDEELLAECMNTALRHIEIAAEFSENLAEAEKELLEAEERSVDVRKRNAWLEK